MELWQHVCEVCLRLGLGLQCGGGWGLTVPPHSVVHDAFWINRGLQHDRTLLLYMDIGGSTTMATTQQQHNALSHHHRMTKPRCSNGVKMGSDGVKMGSNGVKMGF